MGKANAATPLRFGPATTAYEQLEREGSPGCSSNETANITRVDCGLRAVSQGVV